jgi:hypothetical protein
VTEALWKEYEQFATRNLSEVRPLYLLVDGVAEKPPGGRRARRFWRTITEPWRLQQGDRRLAGPVANG